MHLDKVANSQLISANPDWTDVLISDPNASVPFDLSKQLLSRVPVDNCNIQANLSALNRTGTAVCSSPDGTVEKPDAKAKRKTGFSSKVRVPLVGDSCPDFQQYRGSAVFPEAIVFNSHSFSIANNSDHSNNISVVPFNNDSKSANGPAKAPESETSSHKSASSSNSGKAAFYIGDGVGLSPRENKDVFHLFRKPSRRVQIKEMDKGKSKKQPEPAPEFTPPDGGYGWVIALSACIVNLFIVGTIRAYGVLYVAMAEQFPEASAYQASWVPVLLSTSGLLIAPAVGILCRKFTSRKVSFAGGLLSFAGIFIGAYARSITEMILSFGLLTGLGAGLITTPGVLITSLYFEKRRGMASAICVSGNALGGFIFPPLIELLLRQYGFRGAMLIIAALQLNICAASMLFRPIRLHALIQKRERMKTGHAVQVPKTESGLYSDAVYGRRDSLLMRVARRRLQSESESIEEEEIHRQVSFLRSSSMMNSIPDLTQYARSWSVSGQPALTRQESIKPSYNTVGSKVSLASFIGMLSDVSQQEGSVTWRSADEDTKTMNRASHRSMSIGACTADDQHSLLYRQPSRKYRANAMSSVMELDDVESPANENEHHALAAVMENDETTNESYVKLHLGKCTDVESHENMVGSKLQMEETIVAPPKHNCCLFVSNFFDCLLMKNYKFLLVNLSVFLVASGAPHAMFYLPAHAESIDIERTAVVSLISISSIIDLFGRLGTGLIADMNVVNDNALYALSAAFAGSGLIFLPLVQSYQGLAVLMSLYGFGVGAWFVMIPTILAKDHGVQRLASTYGLVRMFNGFMNFISPQISGLLIDVSKSYETTYFYMGACMLAGSVIMIVKFILSLSKCKTNRVKYES